MKQIVIFKTFDVVPEGAIYLSTQIETYTEAIDYNDNNTIKERTEITKAYHYFLVDAKEV